MGVELYKHNKVAYDKVREMLEKEDKVCVVHATGTGKSFIALKLIYDYITKQPDSRIMFLAPLSGIGEQIREHISTMDLPEDVFENVMFNNYQTLVAKSEKELKELEFDLLVLDEFHHIGAPEWTKRLQTIIESNPEAKIFGMSATSVRAFGTKHEEDVAETFFEGNVASRYDLAQAIVDGTLPQPNYHAALAVLEGDCAELERKISDGNASPEEKQQYQKVLSDIRKKISEGETADEIIRNHIKGTGKYIYFCPKGSDISSLQDNIKRMLPDEYLDNIEFYQVHSSEQSDKENKLNANNFYHNITLDGQDAKGKLRIMFAIDMYNEGIHVPDIDGVIMGRATKSDITFYQQLGRALAVKKKNDGSGEIVEPPLVIDLMGNLKEIKKLYMRVETRKQNSKKDPSDENNPTNKTESDNAFDINFGLSEEIINLLGTLEELKSKLDFTLDFDARLQEVYDYLQSNGRLPKWDEQTQFTDGRIMSNWITQKRKVINKLASDGNNIAQIISEQFKLDPDELFLVLIEEALEYCKKNGGFPKYDDSSSFSTGTVIYHWSKSSKDRIEEYALKGNEIAKKLYSYYTPTLDEAFTLHIDEMYSYIQQNGRLPQKSKQERFSDGNLMSAWLNKNRKKIEQSGLGGNEKAELISQYQKNNSRTKENKDRKTIERIIEIIEYYNTTGSLPNASNQAKFSNGADMTLWVKSNGKLIQSLIEKGCPEAIKLYEIQSLFTNDAIFENKLQEVVNYIEANGINVTSVCGAKFSDGSDMYSWISSNRSKVEEYALNNNGNARYLLTNQYSEKLRTKSRLDSYEQHLHEMLEYVKINGRLPKNSEKVRFSDGNLMMSWLNDSKQLIKEKAENGDELSAISYDIIYRNSEQGKFEIHTSEILKFYKTNGYLPLSKKTDSEFTDNASMYNWLTNQRKKLYEKREEVPMVGELVQLILASNPTYFDKVKEFETAKSEFEEQSEFKKAISKKGVRKSNGK